MIRNLVLSSALLASVAACGSSKSGPSAPRTVFGGDRPVTLQIPTAYDGTAERPLLVILHGYSVTGPVQEAYLEVNALVNSAGIFVIAPNGLIDSQGEHFWNATDACCNFDGNPVDDVAYIKGLIADIRHDYKIDPKRIFVWGHSNGAFMTQRMACEDSTELAAVVSLAGAQWQDATKCTPADKVSVLDIHGDADTTIAYGGGAIVGNTYPGEIETMTRWQTMDACTPGLVDDATMLDLVSNLPGAETKVSRFAGCPAGIGAELWTIQAGGHIPTWNPGIASTVYAWLSAHPKP